MEQRKPRNKKSGNKPVQKKEEVPKASVRVKNPRNEKPVVPPGVKKLTPEDYDYVNSDKNQFAHLKRETEAADRSNESAEGRSSHSRRKVLSNWGKYEEEILKTEEPISSKDFQSLLNAPISQGGHFVFKAEKNWAIEVTKYSDFFSLNVKKLARYIDCVPFTEYIDVEDKYFTVDQLTRFHNLAEKSRSSIKLENAPETRNNNSEDDVRKNLDIEGSQVSNETPEAIENDKVEEDLDFLLSLTEPVKIDQPRIVPSVYQIHTEEEKAQTTSAPVKSIDLEKWLDTLLDT